MRTIVLIGCSKTKRSTKGKLLPCDQLYCSPLFKKRMAYAEKRDLEWAVLSAKYGLWWPGSRLKTYELTMEDLPEIDVAAWHAHVAAHVTSYFDDDQQKLKEVTFEFHAGRKYREPLRSILELLGFKTSCPCEGMGIGEQLHWLDEQNKVCGVSK